MHSLDICFSEGNLDIHGNPCVCKQSFPAFFQVQLSWTLLERLSITHLKRMYSFPPRMWTYLELMSSMALYMHKRTLSTPSLMHGGLICIAFCLCVHSPGFVELCCAPLQRYQRRANPHNFKSKSSQTFKSKSTLSERLLEDIPTNVLT